MPATDLTAVPSALVLEQLPDDVATLRCMIVELVASLGAEQRDNASLRHRLDLLLRRLYGPRSERVRPDQLLLFAEPAAAADADAPPATEPAPAKRPPRRCRPHGRRRLPANLPREPRHHELPEAARLCACCGQVRSDIGVDRSEQLEYRPASLLVIEHFVHKYVCPCCSRRAAPSPEPSGSEADPMPAAAPEPAPATATPLAEATPPPAEPEAAKRLSAEAASAIPPAASAGAVPPAPGAAPTNQEPQCPDEAPAAPAASTPASPVAVGAGMPSPIIVAAVKPAVPFAKGLPGPGLLAHLIVSKYADHLPLYRLERIYERQGVFLPRSTLSDWLATGARLLRPLYDLLVAVLVQSRALHTDDTTVKMQDPATHLLSTARLWVYLGDADHPYNAFDFTVNRKRDGPADFLADYQGYLHADAFSGYDGLYLPDRRTAAARILEVACNAHARRKFYEARSSDALRAHQALAYYGQLYELERAAQRNAFSDAQRAQMRQELAVPILERFRQWLESQRGEVLPKSPLGEAIGYALHNWTALVRYTEAGFLAIDNNVAEREMKRIAIGRKNWLFVGSPQGGETAAVLLSFTSTCQRLEVEPWAYLQDVLTRLPTTPSAQLSTLLPDHWQAARPAPSAPDGPPNTASAPNAERLP